MSRRSRPWLLLWLLPYLVFNVASDCWHSCECFSVHGLISAAQSVSAHGARAVSQLSALVAGGECFACDWAANSASHVPVTVPTMLVRSVATSPLPFRFSLHASPAWSWRNRGPPLV